MSYVRTGGIRRGLGIATFVNSRPAPAPIKPVALRPPVPTMTTIQRPLTTIQRPMTTIQRPATPIFQTTQPLFPPGTSPFQPVKPPSIIPAIPYPRPAVTIGRPAATPISIKPVLQATGIKVVTQLSPRRSVPIFSVPNSILPPKDLTIARPLPPVIAPTVSQALTTPDTIINTPAGPVAVPAANSPAYSGGGDGGSAFTGGGGGGAAPSSFAPDSENEEASAAPPAAPAPAEGGIMSGPLPWIIGGGLALWLLTRK
jgi:hypothetical protein